VAGLQFQADQTGWTWDGKDEPPPGSRVEKVVSPTVMVDMPQEFTVEVGTQDPIQYFQKRQDDLYELRSVHLRTGLSIASKVEKGASGRILLRDLSIGTRLLERRKPVAGVALDVGEPLLSTKEHRVSIALKPGHDYGFLLLSDGMGALVGRLRLELEAP